MRRAWVGLLAVAAAADLGLHGSAAAQVHLETRGGISVGSHTATAAALDLVPALSYEALVLRQAKPWLAVYVGYVRTAFGCEQGFCLERDLTVTGNHGVLGVELRRGGPWLRAGLLFGVTEVGTEGEPADAGVGLHAGAGLMIGSSRVRFLPGLFYRWLAASTPSSSGHAAALGVDLGIRIHLGS